MPLVGRGRYAGMADDLPRKPFLDRNEVPAPLATLHATLAPEELGVSPPGVAIVRIGEKKQVSAGMAICLIWDGKWFVGKINNLLPASNGFLVHWIEYKNDSADWSEDLEPESKADESVVIGTEGYDFDRVAIYRPTGLPLRATVPWLSDSEVSDLVLAAITKTKVKIPQGKISFLYQWVLASVNQIPHEYWVVSGLALKDPAVIETGQTKNFASEITQLLHAEFTKRAEEVREHLRLKGDKSASKKPPRYCNHRNGCLIQSIRRSTVHFPPSRAFHIRPHQEGREPR